MTYLLPRSFFERSTDCILDFQVKFLDAASYANQSPSAVLKAAEQAKKTQYQEACSAQRRTFVPCIASTDGILGDEFKSVLARLASVLADKWGQPYSHVRGFLNARVSLCLVRASSLCLRGSRVPRSKVAYSPFLWDDARGPYSLTY